MKAIELRDQDVVALLLWRFATTRFRITDTDVERFLKAKLELIAEPEPGALTLRLLTDEQAQQAAEGKAR
jgi:hypothetical protein